MDLDTTRRLIAAIPSDRVRVAETGAGMHGVATATVAALFGMQCDVYMGGEDIDRQAPNVQRMKLLTPTTPPSRPE